MRVGDLLRQLDGRVLPRLAQVLIEVGQGPLRLRVLTWTALLSAAAVLSTAVWVADRRPVGDRAAGEVARVGVTQGESIPRYVENVRGELAALAGPGEPAAETYALVTLTNYLPPDRLAPALRGAPVAEVFGRVPLRGVQTQIVRIPALRVPEDVVTGMAEVAQRKDREAADYAVRAATVRGEGVTQRERRALYRTNAEIATAEAAAYRSRCSCVYAAVVRATPQALRGVAERPEVRAVDPAPEVSRLDRAVFTPPLPEQTDVVRPPTDSVLPGTSAAGVVRPPSGKTPGDEPADGEITPSVVPSVAPPPSPTGSSTDPAPSVPPTTVPATVPTSADSDTPLASPPIVSPTAGPSSLDQSAGA